jgi:hypothetical protein
MAGKMPLFAAAPRCVISINGVNIAYAVGLSMSVSTIIEPVRILGAFAPVSFEPLMVNPVRGTFQIVRLLDSVTRAAAVGAATNVFQSPNRIAGTAGSYPEGKEASDGSAFTEIGMESSVGTLGTANASILNQTGLYRHLDPVAVLLSQSFDIDIKLRVPLSTSLTDKKFTNGSLNSGEYTLSSSLPFIRIKDARFSGARGSITPGTLFRESFTFEGLLAVSHFDASEKPVQKLDTTWTESPGGV